MIWQSKQYKEFNTNLTFKEVRDILKVEQMNNQRSHITRHTVLGKWHEIKMTMYIGYLKSIQIPSIQDLDGFVKEE
jgi:hypothetical protein